MNPDLEVLKDIEKNTEREIKHYRKKMKATQEYIQRLEADLFKTREEIKQHEASV